MSTVLWVLGTEAGIALVVGIGLTIWLIRQMRGY